MFETVSFDQKIIDILFDVGVLNDSTHKLLTIVEQSKGYIAGGFALQVYQSLVYRNSLHQDVDYLRNEYLQSNLTFEDVTQTDKTPSPGDIDVWFETEEDAVQFFTMCSLACFEPAVVYNKRTQGGFAVNYFCFLHDGSCGQKVQVITGLMGTCQTVCEKFDMLNTACALRNNNVIFHKDLNAIVANNNVVLNERSRFMSKYGCVKMQLNRLVEWGNRHKYNIVTEQTCKFVNDHFDKFIAPIDSVPNVRNFLKQITDIAILNIAQYFTHKLSDDNLFSFVEYLNQCDE